MRRLAKSLGVEAMSLYNHVSSKADVLDGICERVFSEIDSPDPALPWPDQVRAVATSMHRALRRHPMVPLALVTDQSNPTSTRALRPINDLAAALHEAGFQDNDLRCALGAVNNVIFGSLLLSTAGFTTDQQTHTDQQVTVYRDRIDPAQLPDFSRLLQTLPSADPEADFQRMLDMLISGLVATARPDT